MIYGVMILVTLVLAVIKCFFYTHVTLRAACKLHDSMFRKVLWKIWTQQRSAPVNLFLCQKRERRFLSSQILASPMSFFDTTPTGRILNRFAKDQEELDSVLPLHMDPFLQFCLLVTFTIVIIASVFPAMLAAVVVMGVLFTLILL